MCSKKKQHSDNCFVLGIDKPAGMSSHDVVYRVRRIFGEQRVGHFGTLDPFATGILPVGVGPAARLDAYLTNHDKTYVARIVFGTQTTTYDCTGEVVLRARVPASVAQEAYARNILATFTGEIEQYPPQYSAVKIGGVKACDNARAGASLDIPARRVCVYRAELDAIGCLDTGELYWDVSFAVSKGTYIRSLAHDIGLACGCGAYLASLRRTTFGCLGLDACVSLEELEELAARGAFEDVQNVNAAGKGRDAATSAALAPLVIDPAVLLRFSLYFAAESDELALFNGNRILLQPGALYNAPELAICCCRDNTVSPLCEPTPGMPVCVCLHNRVLALYHYEQDDTLVCDCSFHPGIFRGSR